MKVGKRTLAAFNSPDTILVLSKYPYQDIPASHHGVAVYTQETLRTVAKTTGQRFVVLVQHEYQREVELDADKKILIIPAFKAGAAMYSELLTQIQAFSQISTLHIHSEFYTSGEVVQMATALPFYGLLKLMGKHITYVAHNVVDDFSFIAGHLGTSRNNLKISLFEKLVPLYYRLLSESVNRVLALDESVKQRLAKYIPEKKIVMTPIWVHPTPISNEYRRYWRQKMGYKPDDIVLTIFGFVSSYKGVDWLVETIEKMALKNTKNKIHLLIAGGKAPSQTGRAHYEKYYQELMKKVDRNAHIRSTGFIKTEDLKKYFAVTDLVVLPYRGILGSSASWASALSYRKPFIVSKEMSPYFLSSDVQEALAKTGINGDSLVFNRTYSSFVKTLKVATSPSFLLKMKNLSKELGYLRSPQYRMGLEKEILYTAQKSVSPLQWKGVNLFSQAIFSK